MQNSAYLSYAAYRNEYTRVWVSIFPCLFLYVRTYFVLMGGTSAAAKGAGFELAQHNLKVQVCCLLLEYLAVMILEVLALI